MFLVFLNCYYAISKDTKASQSGIEMEGPTVQFMETGQDIVCYVVNCARFLRYTYIISRTLLVIVINVFRIAILAMKVLQKFEMLAGSSSIPSQFRESMSSMSP